MHEIGEKETMRLWLHYASESSVRLIRMIDRRYPDSAEAFALAKRKSADGFDFLPEACRKRLFEAAESGFMERYTDWLTRHGVDVYMPEHEDYPSLLREIPDPPAVLFVRGRLMADMTLPIAIVGSRRPTAYGRDVARMFAYEFAGAGSTVISGMAAGIDSSAARGALECAESPYPTVAVLGSGIDVVYPPGNEKLFAEIAERGAVVTEFLPKARPLREHFPIRNRIISGLSRGVLVVEAGERSGTSITASLAHDQGREVFAIPGRITDRMSVGTNRMIYAGEAKPVLAPSNVLAEFDFLSDDAAFLAGTVRVSYSSLSATEKAIYDLVRDGEKSFDELCEALPDSPAVINSVLTGMQFSGIMKQLPGRVYALDALRTAVQEDR